MLKGKSLLQAEGPTSKRPHSYQPLERKSEGTGLPNPSPAIQQASQEGRPTTGITQTWSFRF